MAHWFQKAKEPAKKAAVKKYGQKIKTNVHNEAVKQFKKAGLKFKVKKGVIQFDVKKGIK